MLGPTASARPATDPGWAFTGSLNARRNSHTATVLPNGKVLVAGGNSGTGIHDILRSAELYDPATGTWSLTGSMDVPRYHSTATLLPNGKVLVAEGITSRTSVTATAELYDPATGTWSLTGDITTTRFWHSATLLRNGKLLIAGGHSGQDGPRHSAELYDPASGTWSVTGRLLNTGGAGRMMHTATLLQNGKVLVAGGIDGDDFEVGFSSAELYNPDTGTWSVAGSLSTNRALHTATLLQNGKVLVVGGSNAEGSAELYDPATDIWSHAGTLSRYGYHTATLLPSGQVLIAGGSAPTNGSGLISVDSADLYDPHTGIWSNTASLHTARYSHTATPLQNGKVLIVGGFSSTGGTLDSAELYDSGTTSTANPIDDEQFFVRQHYLDFLYREPDAGGLAYWTNEITQCGSVAACIHRRRIGVSAAFFIEQEFQETGYYVYRFYKASFDRPPNHTEFTSDRSRVVAGANLEASKQAFADEWVQRPAFVAAYPATMSNTEVVNKLFNSAGLTGSRYDPLRQQEISAMNAGRNRALVLRDVIEIPDFKSVPNPNDPRYSELKQLSQYNPAFVLMQYGYLRRNVDSAGYAFWLDVVNNREPNNYRGMVCAFITSSEYQLRFGSIVTRSNADCSQ